MNPFNNNYFELFKDERFDKTSYRINRHDMVGKLNLIEYIKFDDMEGGYSINWMVTVDSLETYKIRKFNKDYK